MPTYDYECAACGHKFEKFQSITSDPIKECPACHKKQAKRLIGIGAGVIFKGGGFYETDYRSDSYSKDAKKDSDGGGEAKSDSKSDSKPGTKAESKPAKTEARSEPAPKPAAKASTAKDKA